MAKNGKVIKIKCCDGFDIKCNILDKRKLDVLHLNFKTYLSSDVESDKHIFNVITCLNRIKWGIEDILRTTNFSCNSIFFYDFLKSIKGTTFSNKILTMEFYISPKQDKKLTLAELEIAVTELGNKITNELITSFHNYNINVSKKKLKEDSQN